MKPGRASRTAEGVAAVRAAESYRPEGERLFHDPYAKGFLRPFYRALIELSRIAPLRERFLARYDRRLPGAVGNTIGRTCFIDDALRAGLGDGAAQVVILGAGFDARPYRIAGIERARVFEVDHPSTQAMKRERLGRMLAAIPPHVTFVPIDFDREKLGDALATAGYRPDARTFFIWEGVTGYLTPEAVDATFRFVASAGPESRIVFTYIHRGVIDGTAQFDGARELIAFVRRAEEPFTFGFEPGELPGYLAERGLALLEDAGATEYQSYLGGRTGRLNAKVSAFSKAAVARVTCGG